MRPVFWLAGGALLLITAAAGFQLGKLSNPDTPVVAQTAINAKKVLYYRNPMGLADTSPTPKQDSMGMDYIPVYENDVATADTVRIDSQKIQTLGVQSQAVSMQAVAREIRALGTITIDDTAVSDISPRFAGWINDLRVNTQGQRIAKGDILFNVTIPNLYYAELAYKQAVKRTLEMATATPEAQRQAELQLLAAMERLEEIGVPLEEMERLQRGGEASSQLAYRSLASGVVLEKNVVQGARFNAGERLYRVADLNKLWLQIQLPEQALGQIKTGDSVRVALLATAGKVRKTQVDFIYPILSPDTRSLQARASLDNSDGALKPGQSAEVWLQGKPRQALTIPSHALLDSGQKQWVLVELNKGVYQPRQVQTGERTPEWIEISEGLSEGEQVVTQANFLIDSESRLQAALATFTPAKPTADADPATQTNAEKNNRAKPAEHQHHDHSMEH